MNILIPRGQSCLLVHLHSPANFGSSGGRATLDRPVALNPLTGLPYLPFSSLAGVLAGRYGDVYSNSEKKTLNRRRTATFGNPDVPGEAGVAGTLVFGDGELLSFPVPLRDGRMANVIPMSTVARLERLGFLSRSLPPVGDAWIAYTMLGDLTGGIRIESNPTAVHPLIKSLAPLVGKPPGTLVLAADAVAKALWFSASEVRTMTALLSTTRHVRAGSLRNVELLPPGTVLISLVTNQSPQTVNLGSDRLQLGGWEAWGCGFARIKVFDAAPAGLAAAVSIVAPRDMTRLRPDEELMVAAFRAVRKIEDAALWRKCRSLLRETSSRIRSRGVPATLAFSLAKARLKLKSIKVNEERKAHRWLLETLFNEQDVYEATVEAIRGARPTDEVEPFCRWLARYLSVEPQGTDDVPAEETA